MNIDTPMWAYPHGRYKELEFNVYGTTVKGYFVKIENDRITIKTTVDFIKDTLGENQTIHKNFCVNFD